MTRTSLPDGPVDVLVVGAGISGIGMACHLRRSRPTTSFAIVEAREAIGGTWDLFRYPGVRSDSDLHTFAYDFRPWPEDVAIATGEQIRDYLEDTVDEYRLRDEIRFGTRVVAADWDVAAARWRVTVERDGDRHVLGARWLFLGAGYYDYEQAHRPAFDGEADFRGRVVHPQFWPDDLDVTDLRVAVVGSGATAVTLVPALTDDAAHVVQVQRTPSYVMPRPRRDAVADVLRGVLPDDLAHAVIRSKNIALQRAVHGWSRRDPDGLRAFVRRHNRRLLPDDFPVDVHLRPPYDPWDQRLCADVDGELHADLAAGRASIVTGTIDRFVPEGIRMDSGELVEADVVVTATGLRLRLFGGVDLSVDGEPVDVSERLVFRGMMLDGVPNLAFAIGYTTSSWTLKVGLLCEYLVRLLDELDERGMAVAEPVRPRGHLATQPLLDFAAGYVQRALHLMPRRLDAAPWDMSFSYAADARLVRRGPVLDPALRLAPAPDAERV